MESEKIVDRNLTSIQTLSFNPFFLSSILQHFLSGYGKKQPEFHLLYLVFPVIFYKSSREFLLRANKKSSIFSMFLDDVESRILLGGIQERYFYFKELTSQAIVVAVNDGSIGIGEQITLLNKVDYKSVKAVELRSYYRAAHYLGVIFSRTSCIDIFRKLGVTNL